MTGDHVIAHGYLTLSLAPWMLARVVTVDGVQAAVNYVVLFT
jgi:acyl dehydratase